MFFIVWVVASYIILIVILNYMKSHSKTVWLVHERPGTLAMGAGATHALAAKDWSSIVLRIITDPTIMILQMGNVIGAIFLLCYKMMMIIPALAFWFAIYLFVCKQDVFNLITLAEIKRGFGDGGVFWSLLLIIGMLTLGFIMLFKKKTVLCFRNYIEEGFLEAVKKHLRIPDESLIYLEKSKAKMKSI